MYFERGKVIMPDSGQCSLDGIRCMQVMTSSVLLTFCTSSIKNSKSEYDFVINIL